MNPQQQLSADGGMDPNPVPSMQSHPSEQETQPAVAANAPPEFAAVKQEVPIALEHALIRTLAMLQQHNLASAEDCSQVAATIRRNWEAGKGADPIDCLARLRSGGGEMLDASVEMISSKLGQSLPVAPVRVSFASRLIPPTGLYEKHPNIALLCKLMLVPISFAEDEDIVGLATINPYFADALSAAISEDFKSKTGVSPIVSIIRLDYIGWMKMCQKHFKQGVRS